MKLNLRNLKKYEKQILSIIPKKGDKKKDSVYFDFDEKIIYFRGDACIGHIYFDFEKEEDDEIVVNLFIEANKLLMILKDYEDPSTVIFRIEETDKNIKVPIFYHRSNSYIITHIIEKEYFEVNLDNQTFLKATIDEEVLNLISESNSFISQYDETYNSIVISENKVLYFSPAVMYSGKISYDLELKKPIFLHKFLVKILSFFSESVDIETSEETTVLYIKDQIRILFSNKIINKEVPDQTEIDKAFPRENKMVLNVKDFTENLRFLDPFYSQDSKPVTISVDLSNNVVFSNLSDTDTIHRQLDAISVDEDLAGYRSSLNANLLKEAMKVFKSFETCNVYCDCDENYVGIVLTDSEETSNREISIVSYMEN